MRKDDEFRLQCAVIELLRYAAVPNVIWYHPPNGSNKSRAQAGRFKAMGLVAGVPDLALVLPTGYAAYIEFKAPKGVLSEAQEAFRAKCITMGVPYVVIQSFDQAKAVLEGWNVLRTSRAVAA